eukprot:180096-Pelagomonas_calceolata.AAC.3
MSMVGFMSLVHASRGLLISSIEISGQGTRPLEGSLLVALHSSKPTILAGYPTPHHAPCARSSSTAQSAFVHIYQSHPTPHHALRDLRLKHSTEGLLLNTPGTPTPSAASAHSI